MKFPIRPVGNVEITGIEKIVENDVQLIRENGKLKKEKVGTTKIWMWHTQGKTPRWLQWDWGNAGVMGMVNTGLSLIQMHGKILHAMYQRDHDVWFHGDTCNIDHVLNYYEVYPRKKDEIASIRGTICTIMTMNVSGKNP